MPALAAVTMSVQVAPLSGCAKLSSSKLSEEQVCESPVSTSGHFVRFSVGFRVPSCGAVVLVAMPYTRH